MLLPGKSQDEIAQVLRRMIKEDTDDSGNIKASSSSSFELRIREIYLENKKELKQKSNQERESLQREQEASPTSPSPQLSQQQSAANPSSPSPPSPSPPPLPLSQISSPSLKEESAVSNDIAQKSE
ncbi:unnamed protein product [Acanthosepion pharaonis]|uniref:Uncharacterized protein n=1 Tax=Acanthosepion pharaonis TaxID=158019 RepID=A0A812E7T3_ACAPH|nr:unnamed protein product [Sepia pharaonis]